MRIITAFFLLFFSLAGTAQDPSASFPKSFMGNWKGTLQWYKPDSVRTAQTINMELRIQPSKDSAGQYTWNIIYGSATADNRPYILKPVDTAKGHWVIDEVNGIILDQYWKGGKFCGAFTVGTATIVNTYWIENGQLMAEFLSYPIKPVAVTGKGTEESPKVDSYAIRSYQKAILKKQ
jgi:hypothetical protein